MVSNKNRRLTSSSSTTNIVKNGYNSTQPTDADLKNTLVQTASNAAETPNE